jgi:uncharacterized protein (DUF1778 family)
MAKRMGRPPLPEDEKVGAAIRLRMLPEQEQLVREAAERAGKTLSAWTREALERAARRELRRG